MGNRLCCCCALSSPDLKPSSPGDQLTEWERREEEIRRIRTKAQGRRPSVSSECVDVSKTSTFVKRNVPKPPEAVERIKDAVAHNFMFNSLDPQQQQDIINAMDVKEVNSGDTIIKQGDAGDYFYVVDSGEFNVYKDNAPNAVFHYTKGGTFGELALMYNSPRAATVKAATDGVLFALDRETFRNIIVHTNRQRSQMHEKLLSEMEMMQKLTSQERSTIADALQPVYFKTGDVIIQQGDADYCNFHFYILVEGQCYFSYSDGSKSTRVGEIKAVSYFGEKALSEKSKRAVSVIAESEVKCLSMDVATFERLMGPFQEIFNRKIHEYINASELHQKNHPPNQI